MAVKLTGSSPLMATNHGYALGIPLYTRSEICDDNFSTDYLHLIAAIYRDSCTYCEHDRRQLKLDANANMEYLIH